MRVISESRKEPKVRVKITPIVRLYDRWERSNDPTPFHQWVARKRKARLAT